MALDFFVKDSITSFYFCVSLFFEHILFLVALLSTFLLSLRRFSEKLILFVDSFLFGSDLKIYLSLFSRLFSNFIFLICQTLILNILEIYKAFDHHQKYTFYSNALYEEVKDVSFRLSFSNLNERNKDKHCLNMSSLNYIVKVIDHFQITL